jgi:hypothetical protein
VETSTILEATHLTSCRRDITSSSYPVISMRASRFDFPPDGRKITATFPLPVELRCKILEELLVLPHPVFLKPVQQPKISERIFKPSLSDAALAYNFNTLAAVSKATREEAQQIFFERNTWHLELSLWREKIWERDSFGRVTVHRRFTLGPYMGINTATFIQKLWGKQALLRLRDIILQVRGTDLEAEEEMKIAIHELVGILNQGANLKKLSVKWQDHYALSGYWCGTGRIQSAQLIAASSRKDDGTRDVPIGHPSAWGTKQWATRERILEPLKELRGLEKVVVMGCVTDEWAEELKQCMESDPELVPGVKRKEPQLDETLLF